MHIPTLVFLLLIIIASLLWLLSSLVKGHDRDIAEAQIEILLEAQIRICDGTDKAPMAHLIDIQNDLEKGLA